MAHNRHDSEHMLRPHGLRHERRQQYIPNQETWDIIILWVAFLIYQMTIEVFKNPLFGTIFLLGNHSYLRRCQLKGYPQKNLEANALIIDTIHTLPFFSYTPYTLPMKNGIKWGLE